ncbi:Uncharacterized protein SCF082_LOCUS52204 [Durusdinium trenchii]|uniref:ShKT domain-containing protein n=1 Tax=Durusdinium trenchii TaxID=1381693 RepID=A0ABP0SJR8_9DINO
MAVGLLLVLLTSFPEAGAQSSASPLQTAAKAAGCGQAEPECVLQRLFAPSEQQAAADANLSRLPSAPPAPMRGVFESLLQTGAALAEVPLAKGDQVGILGSGAGRLPLFTALLGLAPRIIAWEKDPEPCARGMLALRRLRDHLNNFGDDLVDLEQGCADRAAKGECAKSPSYMAANCTRSCYNRTDSSFLRWHNLEVQLQQGAWSTANLSEVTLAILERIDEREVAAVTNKLEAELTPGAVVWRLGMSTIPLKMQKIHGRVGGAPLRSLDPLPLQGAKVQEPDAWTTWVRAGVQ